MPMMSQIPIASHGPSHERIGEYGAESCQCTGAYQKGQEIGGQHVKEILHRELIPFDGDGR